MTIEPALQPPHHADPFQIPTGFPIHLHERTASQPHLTRCGLFAAGAPARMSDQIEKVDCFDCLAEGPASAYVVLPDGPTVDRRSSALDHFPYAVAVLRDAPAPAWFLATWEDGISDAEFTVNSTLRTRTTRILTVQHSGRAA